MSLHALQVYTKYESIELYWIALAQLFDALQPYNGDLGS